MHTNAVVKGARINNKAANTVMTTTETTPPAGSVTLVRDITVEWGNCDPLGIIFYPTYFHWIDASSQALFREVGHDMRSLRKEFGLAGPVIVDVGAQFLRPISFGDIVRAEAWIGEWRSKTFRVDHRFLKGDELVCTGHELRAWAIADPETPTNFKAAPIPDTFVSLFTL